jgi:DNA-binding NtrC family response regulator
MKVLVVDDHRSARRVLGSMISSVVEADIVESDGLESARASLAQQTFDIAFVDLRMSEDPSNRDGLTLLREIRDRTATPVVMVTAVRDMPEVRAAIRGGAWDYILKDDLCEEVVANVVQEFVSRSKLEREVIELRARAGQSSGLDTLLGSSPAMTSLRSLVQRVAVSERPVLVVGPSGSGKELVATAIHKLGAHPESPLLDVNCGALPEALIESQLFGHERGAFTGADRRGLGYFSMVERGTLFLDEIAELPLMLQAKLLRVLETARFRPLGATSDLEFRGRVVAATHADLAALVRAGKFREDLFHRLDVLRVRVPSLDERAEDIPLLVAHFAAKQARPLRFSQGAISYLQRSTWSGNVRQMRNVIDRVAVLSDDDPVTEATLRELEALPGRASDLREIARLVLALPIEDKIAALEEAVMDAAMQAAGGNKSAAARLLGVHRKVVERRVVRGAADDD